ncbi:MAG: aldo/keto reductase [Oscillospiraceae bacterium]|jgi:aryl-alcohol dehydrogenase-like predicted oxidoreductase|nr:aldo/keto reductase [Oscillospiraceae bacterium]
MKYTNLFNSDITISQMSMGTWGFSGAAIWGESDDDVSIRTIHKAMDYGINLFDSASRYGDGKAEEVLGKAIKGRRDKVVVATKVFYDALEYDQVIDECEKSLKRLDTDYIDIYQIHWPNRDVDPQETMRAFEKLRRDGKIRTIGVCNHGLGAMEAIKGHDIVLNQLPYSLIWRLIESGVAQKSMENNMAVWAYSPLAQGLLTGKFKTVDDVPLNRRATRFYSSKWGQGRHTDTGFETDVFDFLDRLRAVCNRTGFPMATLAVAFLKSRPGMGSVLIGSRDPVQLDQNVKSFETDVPTEIIDEITDLSTPLKDIMGTNPDLWENADGGRMY